MKAMKVQITCLFLCVVLSLILISPLGAQQNAPPEVITAAEKGLIFYRELVSQPVAIKGKSSNLPTSDSTLPSSKVLLGFEEDDPLDQAYLGKPYQFYVLKKEALLNFTKSSDVSSVLIYIDHWYFPVMIGKNAKTILIVAKINGLWKAVSFGGRTSLAVELDRIRKQWPLEQEYTPLLAEADDAYLFAVPQYDSKNLTVISPDKGAAKDYSKLEDSGKYIERLKSLIREIEKKK